MSPFFHVCILKLIFKERVQNCVRHYLWVQEGSAVLHVTVQEYIQNLNSIHMRALMSNLVDNTNKGTSIKIYTVTYNPVTLRHISILILVNDQLDALFFNVFISTPIHVSSSKCSSSGGPTWSLTRITSRCTVNKT